MLVAPVMGPILGLGMGLATGGPLLTLRTATRSVTSVAVAMLAAAAITRMLPFHEINAELAARTVPTVLDLITASFCALAGVWATVRPGSETASTAAGTSIGISLVPPLCAAGYFIGTAQWELALGAALLFLTNMVAIVVVGGLAFVALGFNRVPIAALEEAQLGVASGGRVVSRVAGRLARFYASRWGGWTRVALPLALVGAVYVPLRSALDEVSWQVQVRRSADAVLDGLEVEIVSSRIRVERHSIDAALVIIGERKDAARIERELDAELRRVSGVVPRVDVRAVPDAEAAAAERVVPLAPAPYSPAPEPFAARLDRTQAELVAAISARWPAATAGDPIAIDVELTSAELSLRVVHLGRPLDAAGREVLERTLDAEFGVGVTLHADALPMEPHGPEDELAFLVEVPPMLALARRFEAVHTCVVVPPLPPPASPEPAAADPAAAHAATGDTAGPVPAESEPAAPEPAAPEPAESEPAAPEPAPSPSPTRVAIERVLAETPRVRSDPGEHWAVYFRIGACSAAGPIPPVPGQ